MIADELIEQKKIIDRLKPLLVGRELEVANSLLVTAEGHSVSLLGLNMAQESSEKERILGELSKLIRESVDLMKSFVQVVEEKTNEQV